MGRTTRPRLDGEHAILGIDLVSYSLLDLNDQLGGVRFLLRSLQQSLEFHGVTPELYLWSPAGDGGYITFVHESAPHAIDVAFTLCEKFTEARSRAGDKNASPPELKIVLHVGSVRAGHDLTENSWNVWGDGINTSHHVLEICLPGQVLVTNAFFESHVRGNRESEIEVGPAYFRSVVFGPPQAIRNVNKYGRAIDESKAQALRWDPIRTTKERACETYRALMIDALESDEPIAALAAARMLLDLGERDAAHDACGLIVKRAADRIGGRKKSAYWLPACMSPDVAFQLLSIAAIKTYKAGQTICGEGEPANHCYFTVSGLFNVCPKEGAPIRIRPGAILGEFSLWISDIRRTASLRTDSDCLVLEVPIEEMGRILATAPAVAETIYTVIGSRILDNFSENPTLFGGSERVFDTLVAEKKVRCVKVERGAELPVGRTTYILFHGRLLVHPTGASQPLPLVATGRYTDAVVAGLCKPGEAPGCRLYADQESIVVTLDGKGVDTIVRSSAEMKRTWTRLYFEWRGLLASGHGDFGDGGPGTDFDGGADAAAASEAASRYERRVETRSRTGDQMSTELDRLSADAMALENSLRALQKQYDDGDLDDGRFHRMRKRYDVDRIRVLQELSALLQGKDPEFDTVIQDVVRRGGDTDAAGRSEVAALAKQKGLGEKVVEKINANKGTVVSWMVEIGAAVYKKAIGS